MKERKKSKDWYIAARHYIATSLMGRLISSIVLVALFFLLGPESLPSLMEFPLIVFPLMGGILGVWLGIMYSANYLKKIYIIENKDKIVNLATIYNIILGVVSFLYVVTKLKGYEGNNIIVICYLIIEVFLFYILSKKYIRNTKEVKELIK